MFFTRDVETAERLHNMWSQHHNNDGLKEAGEAAYNYGASCQSIFSIRKSKKQLHSHNVSRKADRQSLGVMIPHLIPHLPPLRYFTPLRYTTELPDLATFTVYEG
jgi:hypothetical protein